MWVMYFEIEFIVHISQNLKEKRRIINSIKGNLKNKFDVIAKEKDYLDKWQKSLISCISISSEKKYLESLRDKVEDYLEKNFEIELIGGNYEIWKM